jgi:hypothetical protein
MMAINRLGLLAGGILGGLVGALIVALMAREQPDVPVALAFAVGAGSSLVGMGFGSLLGLAWED